MMLRAITAALLVCGAACAESTADEAVPEPVVETVDPAGANPQGHVWGAELCAVPPDAEGACALACDPEAVLEEYVEEGVCVLFECPLANGDITRVGGCNL